MPLCTYPYASALRPHAFQSMQRIPMSEQALRLKAGLNMELIRLNLKQKGQILSKAAGKNLADKNSVSSHPQKAFTNNSQYHNQLPQ